MDLVGPKYLSGGFRFYFFNIIDVETHTAGVYPCRDKTATSITEPVVDFWNKFGIPDFLQMDNELSFRGSNRYPRGLGLLLRFALSLGVCPIFIPPAEPWRNGVIEKFNDNMLKHFYTVERFNSFEELAQKSIDFSGFHNQHHRYSSQSGKTPDQVLKLQGSIPKLQTRPDLTKRMPLMEGKLIFIRFIRSNQILSVLNSRFEVKKELVYTYVVAQIIVEKHILMVIQDNIVHHIFPFVMPVDW